MSSSQQLTSVFEVAEALRNTRDADTCLHGLNQLRRAVRGSDGPAFLQLYLSHAQAFDDLQSIWDAQLTAQNYHVTVTLLLTLADVLSLAAQQQKQARQQPPQQQLQSAAAALAQGILSRRLKALYFNLSSEIRGKANAALALLAALASLGAETTRELARLFDFSLAALPTLARLPRQRKSDAAAAEGAAGLQARLWQQWRAGDVLKRPTRAAFVTFAAALLQRADSLTLSTLLATRPLMGGLLNHMANDPPEVQLQVLGLLRSRVLSHKAGIPPASQAEVLSDAVLSQLSQVATSAAVDSSGQAAAENGDEQAQQAQQAADLAAGILESVATDPSHGLCQAGAAAGVSLAAAVGAELTPGQKRLLRWLQRLRPSESATHMDLIEACTAADPTLAVALLLSLPFSLDPSATGRWLAHTAVAGSLMHQVAGLPVGLSRLAERGGRPLGMDSRVVVGLLRCALPPCLPKSALSRGVQHSSPLVRHAMLCLLARALDTVAALLAGIAAAAAAAEPAGAASWEELGRGVQAAVRAALPDPQPVLALFTALERGQQQQQKAPASGKAAAKAAAGAAGAAEEEEPELNLEGVQEEQPEADEDEEMLEPSANGEAGQEGQAAGQQAQGLAGANEAMVSAVLRVLCGWQRALPAALAEAKVDAERLLPLDLLSLKPQHQYLFLELLLASLNSYSAAHGPTASTTQLASGAPHAHATAPIALPSAALLLPVLCLLCGTQHAEVRQLAWRWMSERLVATGTFGSHQEEVQLWLSLLPRGTGNPSVLPVCAFLSEALMQLQRRPHEFFELAQQQQQQQQPIGAGAAPSSGGRACSLLALCVLRQALRLLPSPKMPSADKAAICTYVAAALGALLPQQQGGARSGAAARQMAEALLGVLRLEAQRGQLGQQQQKEGESGAGASGRKRRKGEAGDEAAGMPADGQALRLELPSEGQCLASLAQLLQQEVQRGPGAGAAAAAGALAAEAGVAQATKKRRKSKGVELELGVELQEQEAAAAGRAVEVVCAAAGDSAGSLPDNKLLKRLLKSGEEEQQQQHAWDLQRRLACMPRSAASSALSSLASAAAAASSNSSSGSSSGSGLALASEAIVSACLAHGLPLPPCFTTDEGQEEPQAWNALLDAAPISLLLLTLMTSSASSEADGGSGGSSSSTGPVADLLAAVQRRLSGGRSGSGSDLWGRESEATVVRQCLHWLERATTAYQVQLMLQVAKWALSQEGATSPAAAHSQCKPLQPSRAEALGLIAQHPLVQSALVPAAAGAAGLGGQLQAAVAFGVVDLVRQQLQEATGSELSSMLAAAAPLLRLVSQAFLQAVQQPPAVESPAKKKGSKGGSSTAAAAAAAAAGAPPAASLWAMLLPWMGAADLQSAIGSLLHRLQQAGLAAPGDCLPGDRWVLGSAVSTIQELMEREGPVDADLLRSCCAALAWLVAGSLARPADECVLTLLSGPHGQASLACFDQLASQQPGQLGEGTPASELLLQACLDEPSPTRSTIAVALVRHSVAARRRFASSLPALLKRVQDGQASGLVLLACVLPAAAAVMRLAAPQRPGAAATSGSGAGADAGAVSCDATSVAACVREPLLSWVSSKKHASSSDQPAAGAAEAAALLHGHALPCLRLCLELQPLSSDERDRLLQRLLPPVGWHLEPAANNAPGGLTVSERAQAAVLVLELMHSKAAGQQPDAGLLLRYLQTYTATLASLFKLAEPSPGQLQLESLLLAHLDGALGDAVAALPSDQRVTKAFSQLAEAACGFGTSVLRHRFASVAVMCVLRRFMAALLPDEQGDAKDGADVAEVKPTANGAKSPRKGKASSSSSDSDSEDGSSSEESSGSESSSSSDDEGGSPTSSGDRDGKRPARKAALASAGPLRNPPVAAAALQLLQRIMTHSRFVASMRAAAASPPPIPAAAHALPRPLQSLLPLAELTASALAPRSVHSSVSSQQDGGAQKDGGEGMEAAALKRELCELLETLLDLQDQYEKEGGAPAAAVQQAEAALLPLLMAGYGGSLSATDRAVWSLAQAINLRLWRRERPASMAANGRGSGGSSSSDSDASGSNEDEGEEERDALAAVLGGPLSDTGLAWGAPATALQAAGLAQGDDEARRSLLQAKLSLDPLRCALTAVHFPEWRTLSGQGAGAGAEVEASAGSVYQAGSKTQPAAPAAPPALPHAAAGYDPAFLLPFAVVALRQRLLPARSLLQAGALSLCLRALSAADDSLRGLAYEAVALLQEQLEQEEFREKRQLSVLLGALRNAVTTPFQRLPAVHALFLAEAALVVMHPGAAMYPPVNKYLLKRAVLDLQDVPLFGQLMLGGSPQHAAERRWLLQLLAGGLRGAEDARLYRRRYVLELAMSLHDSSVADPQAAQLALSVVCRATYVPRAARQLTAASGLIPWLASAATSFLQSPAGQAAAGSGAGGALELLAQQPGRAAAAASTPQQEQEELQPVEEPVAALLRLTRLRAVVRPGARDVLEDLGAAVQQLAGALGAREGLRPGSALLKQLAAAVEEMRQAGQQQHSKATV